MMTQDWVASLGISTELNPPEIEDFSEEPARSVADIAMRALILHGIVAVGAGVDAARVSDWLKDQELWNRVTPKEKSFLTTEALDERTRMSFFWHKEAQWTLLWIIGMTDHLGLPIEECDSAAIVDRIMPPLGEDIATFIDKAKLRSPGVILAEDDRTYNIWCYANKSPVLPDDLNMRVLYERRYAMEWLDGSLPWDEVTCDT